MFVKIKKYNKMVKENQSHKYSLIIDDLPFTKKMESLMPKNRIIELKKIHNNLVWFIDSHKYYLSYGMIDMEYEDLNDLVTNFNGDLSEWDPLNFNGDINELIGFNGDINRDINE